MAFSGANERDIHWAGNGFTVLKPVRDQPQRKRLHSRCCLPPAPSIGGHAWKGSDVRQPAPIRFPVTLDEQQEPG
jgi:hypothetical protein